MLTLTAVRRSCPNFAQEASEDNSITWSSKRPQAVFRGSTTGGVFTPKNWRDFSRSKAVLAGKERPDLVDAGFTDVVQMEDKLVIQEEFDRLGLRKEPMSHHEQLSYKMVLNIDGNSLADRFPSQLISNSAILKQESLNIEYWYDELVPWKHYIPLDHDLQDLTSTVEKVCCISPASMYSDVFQGFCYGLNMGFWAVEV